MMEDAEEWMQDMAKRMEETERKAKAMQSELTQLSTTVASSDGSVTITVNPGGGLDDLKLGHRACDLGHTKLTALIMSTFHKAQKEAASKAIALFEENFPDSPESLAAVMDGYQYDLDDEDETDGTAQKGWVPEAEPEPEPTRRPQRPAATPTPPSRRRPAAAADDDEFERPW
jgi:DNA-binding protein YbaB